MVEPASHASPRDLFRSLTTNVDLTAQLVRREVLGRYRGSILGLGWSFFNPILMLAIYTFVFSVVFSARWGQGVATSRVDFALILFAGLIVHAFFAECVNRAPGLILQNVNFVKKVVFPLEVLPVVTLCSALFHAVVSLLVLVVAIFVSRGSLEWTSAFAPLVFLPLLPMTIGVAWFLASLGVFARDVGQVMGLLTTVLLFLSPVFYPVSAVPVVLRPWLVLNPLTFIIEEFRAALFVGRLPNWIGLLVYACIACAVAFAGFAWFQKTRKGFADVV